MKTDEYIVQDASKIAQDTFLARWKALNILEGHLSPTGKVVAAYDAENELPPSVARVVKWLDKHTDGFLTVECANAIGMPHKQQLKVAVQDLYDHGIVDLCLHDDKQAFYLTDKGDDIAYDIRDMVLDDVKFEAKEGSLL